MKTRFLLLLTCLTFIFTNANAQVSKQDSAKKKLDELVEKKLLKPVRDIHDKLDLEAFARAYSTETFVYDVYNNPSPKENYYQCVIKEMKGAFITEKNEFRADLKTGAITMFDEKSKKYIALDAWLKKYKEKEEADEKKKKKEEKK